MARRAALDLEAIVEYIAEDSPEAATRFARSVVDAAASLDELAGRGRQIPELETTQLRELLVGAYRLIYRVETHTVSIVAVIHGACDLAALWEREALP